MELGKIVYSSWGYYIFRYSSNWVYNFKNIGEDCFAKSKWPKRQVKFILEKKKKKKKKKKSYFPFSALWNRIPF